VIISPLLGEEMDAAVVPLAARWAGRVRVVRSHLLEARARLPQKTVVTEPSSTDSAAARAGAAVVWWPEARDGQAPSAHADAVWAGDATVVAQLARLPMRHDGQVVARWSDGAPAASEQRLGAGCVRRVSIGIPRVGDAQLQPSFVALKRALELPCGVAVEPATDAALRALARDWPRRGEGAGSRSALPPRASTTLWLLALAACALVLELFARARAEAGR
jgi:hypothetical protein